MYLSGLVANNVGSLLSSIRVDLLLKQGDLIASQTIMAEIDIRPTSISPITAYLSNPYVNSTTYLYLSSNTPGTSVLQTTLKFDRVKCSDFDLRVLACFVNHNKISWKGNSVVIGPFNTTTALSEHFTLQGVIEDVVAFSQF